MKRILIMLLIAAICAAGVVSCKKKETPDNTSKQTVNALVTTTLTSATSGTENTVTTAATQGTVTEPEPDDLTPKPNDTDTILFSRNGISVYFRSVEDSSIGKEIIFFAFNAGEKTVTVRINILTVNRYAISTNQKVTLIPGSAGIINPAFWSSDLKLAGITDITELTMQITAEDSDRNPVFEDQTFTFTVQ